MRRMLTIVAALTLALLTLTLSARPRTASAGEVWCWDDPIFEINGQIVTVNLGVRQSDLASVTGATVVLTVPAGVSARLVSVETTTYTPSVRIVSSGAAGKRSIDANVNVHMSAGKTFDYQITVTTHGKSGPLASNLFALTNQSQSLNFRLGSK
jgi:hypothetical protein